MPAMPDGALVARGHQLVTRTFAFIGPEVADPTKRYAGNSLACQNCHLDAGTNRTAMPLVGIVRTYPKFSSRSGKTISLIERIDECMTRSFGCPKRMCAASDSIAAGAGSVAPGSQIMAKHRPCAGSEDADRICAAI